MAPPNAFVPALLVVDMQEDFCPPSGSLAVPSGRTIAPAINKLLSLPFAVRIGTRDFHPPNHISFASQHPAPNNIPFESTVQIQNPANPGESQTTRLWPDHCVQGTPGSDLIPELDVAKLDHIVAKGQDKNVEMYSAFQDPFGGNRSEVADLLRSEAVTHVFVCGLAADYCVKWTAEDSAKEGFQTFVVKNATKAVDEGALEECYRSLEKQKIGLVNMNSEEVRRVQR